MTSTWTQILEQIQAIQREARKEGSSLWYRGQRLASWPVRSTVHRHVDSFLLAVNHQSPEAEKRELMRSVSKTLFHKFKNRSWPLLDIQERSDWGIVFAMQHHGVPTRLVDWTEKFVCALYFAQLHREVADDAAIFVLKPEKLNQHTLGVEGLVTLGESAHFPTSVDTRLYHPAIISLQGATTNLETLAVAPVTTNPRMVAQRATFTLSGDSFDPIEESYAGCVTKIVLPASASGDIYDFLETVGDGHFSYFPDLTGLAQQLDHEMSQELEATLSWKATNSAMSSAQ